MISAFVALALNAAPQWRPVAPGVEYARVQVVQKPKSGDGFFHIVRIDQKATTLVTMASTEDRLAPRTAAEWSRSKKLAVVFNAGMYEGDHSTHTGAFRIGGHVNSARWVEKYKSALVQFGAKAPVVMVDTDEELTDPTATLVNQNLRLIRKPGVNVWAQNKRKWSEAALASTPSGHLLVVFSRTPFTMHDFNDTLLGLGLGVDAAMHLEGGPEASLSIHGGGIDLDLCGSFETGFFERDENVEQWPLPNVIGAGRRPSP